MKKHGGLLSVKERIRKMGVLLFLDFMGLRVSIRRKDEKDTFNES